MTCKVVAQALKRADSRNPRWIWTYDERGRARKCSQFVYDEVILAQAVHFGAMVELVSFTQSYAKLCVLKVD
jgi:hypothetical protein